MAAPSSSRSAPHHSSIPKLSLCIIARNEEGFLADCLDSTREIADEIVLVDTGSEDRTVEIAQSRGARVLHHEWQDDFALARNAGIDAATGEWIFAIDADERLGGGKALYELISATPGDVGAYVIERHDIVSDRDTGRTVTNTIGNVRLFRRHPGIRYMGAVHERAGDTVLAAGFRLGIASGVRLTHFVKSSPQEVLDRKQRRYLALLDRELGKDPGDPWFRYYRGKTHWYLSNHEAAIQDFTAVEASARAYLFLRASAACMRALLIAELGRTEEAMEAVTMSLQMFPHQSLAHYVGGEILYRKGDFAAAAREYRLVRVSLGDETGVAPVHGDYYMLPEKRAYKLGCCHLALGQLDHARRAFCEGVAANQEDAGCYFGLAHVASKIGDLDTALQFAKAAVERDPTWRDAIRLEQEIPATAKQMKCAS